MGRLCNNSGFRWAVGMGIVIAAAVVGWLISNATFSTQVAADVMAADIKVESVKGQVKENTDALKENQEFQRDMVAEIGKLNVAQAATKKDVEYIREGQKRQEKILERIDAKLK